MTGLSTRGTTGEGVPTVREPALVLSIYMHREAPDGPAGRRPPDCRRGVLVQLDSFFERTAARLGKSRPQRAQDIDLAHLDERAPWPHQESLEAVDDQGRTEELYQALVYPHMDALIVQIHLGRFGPAESSLDAAWEQLSGELSAEHWAAAIEEAASSIFGVSALCWASSAAPDLADFNAPASSITGALRGNPRCTPVDLGLLYEMETPVFSGCPSVDQDRWVLITRHGNEVDEEVQRRYVQPEGPFSIAALAFHKFEFYTHQYETIRDYLDHRQQRLDGRARELGPRTRRQREHVRELGTHASAAFQVQLADAVDDLANYESLASEVKRLRRSLEIARENFVVQCVPLISFEAESRVTTSDEQEAEARAFLRSWQDQHGERIFRGVLGRMSGVCGQLDGDIDYSERVVDRYMAAIRAGTDQLQIAGQRELGEMSHHLSIDSAAVVASLVAFVAVEALVKPLGWGEQLLAVSVPLLLACAAFTA